MTSAMNAGRTRAAGFVWLSCLQFFVAEAFAAAATPGYSYRLDFISDLGATACAAVCSPRHLWMNASFVVQGALIAVGLALAWPALGRGRLAGFGKLCLALCAPGISVVGLAPENVAPGWHYFGAASHLIACNLGALSLGLSARGAPALRAGVLAGALGLAALVALNSSAAAGPGVGATERLASYPFLLWLAAEGAALALARR